MKSLLIKPTIGCLLVATLFVSAAQAQTVYTNRGTFESANPGLDVEGFENGMTAGVCTADGPVDDSGDGVCFGEGALLNGASYDATGPGFEEIALLSAGFSSFSTQSLGTNSFVDATVVNFEAANALAIGFDLACDIGGPTATIDVYGEFGLINSYVASCVFTPRFWGIEANERITRVEIQGAGDSGDLIDNVTFPALPSLPSERSIANFAVWKDFDDDNDAGVAVTLTCNTGLPLQQTKIISDNEANPNRGGTSGGRAVGDPPVTFVVVDFSDGEMDCEITEEEVDGYTVNYYNLSSDSATSCSYQDIGFGEVNQCVITNSLDRSEVEVTKVWIDENPQFNAQNVARARWSCTGVASGSASGYLNFSGNPDTRTFSVYADWDSGTTCNITEVDLTESGVEVDDSDCQGIVLFPGVDGSCTIFNTRLYEGIPTLSQYGLALMALLMLGVGFVAFRRFS